MPRAGWTKPKTDQRLPDHLAIAMVTQAYPPGLVDEVLATTDRVEERQRLLPARVVLYYVVAMALFNEASYEEVMRRLLEGLAWQQGWSSSWQVPTKAAIFKARARLGVEPVAELFHRTVPPLAGPDAPGAWYRGRRVLTMDHLDLELSGPIESDKAKRSKPAGAALSLTGLIEEGTNVVLDIATGPGRSPGEPTPGVLYLGTEQTATPEFRSEVAEREADLLWAPGADADLEVTAELSDGSQLVALTGVAETQTPPKLRRLGSPEEPFLTTLTDPIAAPAGDLEELYAQRATLAGCLDDLRVHETAPTMRPRSKSTDSALQEIYGLLLARRAIKSLLHG